MLYIYIYIRMKFLERDRKFENIMKNELIKLYKVGELGYIFTYGRIF